MIRLVRFFVKHYVFAISIFLAILFFGITTGLRLGVDLLPEFEIPIVAVSTTYPGAGSEATAEQLSEPIEDALATIPGITDITSFSGEGYSFVIAQFTFDTGVDQAAIDVKQRLDAIQGSLPDDASLPAVQKFDPADEPILRVALTAPGVELGELQRYAETQLEQRLQQVAGVADVAVVGPVQREVQVLLDPSLLQRYGLTPAQVAGAIGASSLTVPAGDLTIGAERLQLSVRAAPATAEDVARLHVDPVRGLRVSDVAVVRDASAEAASFVRLNGESAVMLEVRKASGANSVNTARGVRRALAGTDLPDGYAATIVGDTAVFVEDSVFDTMAETGLAVLAVALVVLLFMGRLGSTFSVVLAIPITLTGAVIVFGLLGFTFNTVTLLAVTVAVGLVVDDSIVIAENIERHRLLGATRLEAVFRGVGEVAVPVLTATLSLLAVFLPIAFLPGIIGQFFSQFGLSLAATIAVSYLEAMFFLTVRLAYMPNPLPPTWGDAWGAARSLPRHFRRALARLGRPWTWAGLVALAVAVPYATLLGLELPAGFPQGGAWPAGLPVPPGVSPLAFALLAGGALLALPLLVLVTLPLLTYTVRLLGTAVGAVLRQLFEWTDGTVKALREGYARVLAALLPHSTVVLVVAGLLVASIGVILPRIQFNFISPLDTGVISVSVEMPPGTSLHRTNTVTGLLEAELAARPEIRTVQSTVGGGGGLLGAGDPRRASITAELVDSSARADSFRLADELRAHLQPLVARAYPEAKVEVSSSDGGVVPVETSLSLTLTSTDRDLLRERDALARDVMAGFPYLRNVTSSLEGSVPERVFEPDPEALSGTGLTIAEVATTLRAYNVGASAGNMRESGTEVPIVVKLDPRAVTDEQSLLSLPIYAPALQTYLPLGQLGEFRLQVAPTSIDRSNQAYVATLGAELGEGAPGQFQVRQEVEAALAAAGVTDEQVWVGTGVGPDLLGDLVTFGPIAFALALLLNYLVIASQFNSFKYPLYLLLTVPLALVGAFWLFYLTGSALDVISVLGVVILIGLVTKNSILLLDVVVSQPEPGEKLADALVRAGRLRLRPILMTALTVVIISLPLLLGLGEGSEFRRPLGLVILGGVLSSTLLTLVVVPAAFYRFERDRYDAGPPNAPTAPREGGEVAPVRSPREPTLAVPPSR